MKKFFLLCLCSGLLATANHAQSAATGFLGQRMVFGSSFGTDGSCKNIKDDQSEMALFWSKRFGVSITRNAYAGVQGRFILARNEGSSSKDAYYMAGLWGRFYPVQTLFRDNPGCWGLFVETGIMTGNYYRVDQGDTESIVSRSGRIYIPGQVGVEFRICHGITGEAGVQFNYTAGESWASNGIIYPSMGLNWHIGKGMCGKK